MSTEPRDPAGRPSTAATEEFRAARDLLLATRTSHDLACRTFRWPRATHFNWALEWFDVVAAGNPGIALELIDPDGSALRITYAEMSLRSDAVAAWLEELGVRRGDRVLIVLGTQRELWECLLACLKIGAVAVPTYPSLAPAEAHDRIGRGGIRHVLCRADRTDLFPRSPGGVRIAVGGPVPGWTRYADAFTSPRRFVPAEPTPATDIAFGYFTSGTTSAPKLVAHTHASYPVGHLSSMYWNGLMPGDRHLNVSAPGWAKHSWSSLFVPWNAEATIVAGTGERTPDRLARLLVDSDVRTFCAPPGTWYSLLPYIDAVRPALREATSAGEPLDPEVARRIRAAWGVPVRDGYGQTETTALIGTTPGLVPRPGWLGKVLPGFTVRIGAGQPAGPAAGEIQVDLSPAPVGVMRGYLDDPAGDATAFTAGRYHTGDLGEIDATGWVRIAGRRDDVFKSFGHRVSPYELETVLRLHPAVADAAVVAQPHPVGGSVPHAVVVAHPGMSTGDLPATLLAHLEHHVAPALRPRAVHVTDRLPRTASGKIRRRAVAEWVRNLTAAAPADDRHPHRGIDAPCEAVQTSGHTGAREIRRSTMTSTVRSPRAKPSIAKRNRPAAPTSSPLPAPVTWQVRITNLTPQGPGAPGSQPLSPPVFAVHRAKVHVWQEGQLASHALSAVAEDANNAVLVSALSKNPGVVEAFASAGGPIPSGQSAEFTVRVRPGHRVSIVSMLVNTNDAFTGVDGIRLQGARVTVRTDAYDGGSEVNNEATAFIPGSCCGNFFVREPEGDVIRHHEGITGRGDLDPAVYGWSDPVAEIEFIRVS